VMRAAKVARGPKPAVRITKLTGIRGRRRKRQELLEIELIHSGSNTIFIKSIRKRAAETPDKKRKQIGARPHSARKVSNNHAAHSTNQVGVRYAGVR